jgi:16S rRNA (guanine527-N7)-methyltransferase
VKHRELWKRTADYAGYPLGRLALERLERYQAWLRAEAIPAGALGFEEASRLSRRHIADSLLFAAPLTVAETEIWDLGSGAGLPGIPLAILLEETKVVLVERSDRRVVLLRRAVRVLDLENVEVWKTDIRELEGSTPVLVSRAGLAPDDAVEMAKKLLQPGGIAVWGGSWLRRPVAQEWEVMEIPAKILDQPVWLLIMRHS